jgi:hypothetical protein
VKEKGKKYRRRREGDKGTKGTQERKIGSVEFRYELNHSPLNYSRFYTSK